MKNIIQKYNELKAQRVNFDILWQEINDLMIFRKQNIASKRSTIDNLTREIYDFTASQANNILASGMMTFIANPSENWFILKGENTDEQTNAFFNDATNIVRKKLYASNFYLELHEALLDLGGFGTMCLFSEYDTEKRNYIFKNIPIGSYVIAEDNNGFIATVIREYELTVEQIFQEFTDEELPAKLKEDLEKMGCYDKVTFYHGVCPNRDYDPEVDKPIKSYTYCSLYPETPVRDAGFFEMPYFVVRFNKINDSCYGFSPAQQVLPIIRQLNGIEKSMDILAEKMANPPVLTPDTMAYDINSIAGGITFYDASNPQAMPKEWQTAGRYDVGLDRANEKRMFIKDAFFNNLFQPITSLGANTDMTATEVVRRENERLVTFSPVFSRLVRELLDPLLIRIFNGLLRADEIRLTFEMSGNYDVQYQSRISVMLDNLRNQGFFQYIQIIGSLVQLNPTMLDHIDFDVIVRDMARSTNIPSGYLKSQESVAAAREQRSKQQQEAQQLELAKTPVGGKMIEKLMDK